MQLSLFFLLLFFFSINILTVSISLKVLQHKRIDTSDIFFAKSLARNIYRDVIEGSYEKLTPVFLKEKDIRTDKVEYILAYDTNGYLMANTYFVDMPRILFNLDRVIVNLPKNVEYKITKIKRDGINVFDIAVPILEGISRIGVLHVGIKGSYLRSLFWLSILPSFLVLFVVIFLVFIFRKKIAKKIVKAVDELAL